MLTETNVTAVMERASRDYHASALNHVASIVTFGAYHVIIAESPGSLEVYRRKARNLLLEQGLLYKTAARQVAYAFDVVSMIRRKFGDHARIAELRGASDGDAGLDAIRGFMSDMGIESAGDCALWSEGDGTVLTAEKRATLRSLPQVEIEQAKLSPIQQKLASAKKRLDTLQKKADAEVTVPVDIAETTAVDVERYLRSSSADAVRQIAELCNELLTAAKRAEISEAEAEAEARLAA